VTSRLHPEFRRAFAKLPREIQKRVRAAYRRFQTNPFHPGLQFKRLHATSPLWSARINDSYRVVGIRRDDDTIIWFFVGTHSEYERLLRSS
jgi:mRNA-degrading endonuclease RelE of RelBE toxin-antitoxin system